MLSIVFLISPELVTITATLAAASPSTETTRVVTAESAQESSPPFVGLPFLVGDGGHAIVAQPAANGTLVCTISRCHPPLGSPRSRSAYTPLAVTMVGAVRFAVVRYPTTAASTKAIGQHNRLNIKVCPMRNETKKSEPSAN
jgi:hypothetical protein